MLLFLKHIEISRQVFLGNTNSKDMVKNNLDEPVLALFIRFVPKGWKTWPCMRVEAYGEAASKLKRCVDLSFVNKIISKHSEAFQYVVNECISNKGDENIYQNCAASVGK